MKTTLLGAIALTVSVSSLSAQWLQATPTTSAGNRAQAALTTGPAGNLLMFGGINDFGPVNSTHTYNGTTWSLLNPTTKPSARSLMEMVYDPNAGVYRMYGGAQQGFISTTVYDQTWQFDGTNWSQDVIVGATPGGLYAYAMAFDTVHNVTVIHGGIPDGFFPIDSDRTWEYNGTSWTETAIFPATNPGPLERAAMCFHAGIGKTVLFGGLDPQTGAITGGSDDTWVYDAGTHAWSVLPISGAKPAKRYGADMTYDSVRGVCVMTGGQDPLTSTVYYTDTWEFDGTTWTQVSTAYTGNRIDSTMAYLASQNRVVQYGGINFNTFAVYGDTWEWETGTFGSACPGSNGLPHLSVNQSPRLGQPWVVTASNLNTTFNAGVLVFGFTQIPGGFLLDPFPGMPGCYAYITPDASVGITGSLGDASWTWPSVGGTIGSQFWGQALCYDPGVNAFDFTITQAISGTIGL